jgi:hypothetical protein
MPIGEPFIQVECDKCEYVSDPYSLTMLAGGGWDARNLPRKLEREGWKVEGNVTTCPECVEAGIPLSADPT